MRVFIQFPARTGLLKFLLLSRMDGHGINDADLEQPESEVVEAHYVWQYFTVTNNTEAKKGGSKNAQCMFCDKSFSGCSTSRAAAHILARPVMNQDRAGIQPCVAIKKKDDDRRGSLRKAQKTMGDVIRIKEQSKKERNGDSKYWTNLLHLPPKNQSSLL